MVGLSFVALNVATVATQTNLIPKADTSAAPIGEAGGPACRKVYER